MDDIHENDLVALLVDQPEAGLHRGDVGTVIQVLQSTPDHAGGFIVEFVDEIGSVQAQVDITDLTQIVKLRRKMNGETLQEWARRSPFFVLVFTDIVDSTSLANESGDEKWIALLQKHFAQARRLMAKYEHYEIKIIGDSFMVVFRSVLDAFDFALALHENTGDEQIRIRAGIHVGSPRIIGNDIFGNMVNYTKRVESAKDNKGGIRLSDGAMKPIADEKAQRHARWKFTDKQVPFKGYKNAQTIWVVSDHYAVFKPPRGFVLGEP